MGNCQSEHPGTDQEEMKVTIEQQQQQFQQQQHQQQEHQMNGINGRQSYQKIFDETNTKKKNQLTNQILDQEKIEGKQVFPIELIDGSQRDQFYDKNNFESQNQVQQSSDQIKNQTNLNKSSDQNNEQFGNNLLQYRKQLDQDLIELEQNPPLTLIDLSPFNYGDEPQYPKDFTIELRKAYKLPDGSTYIGEWNNNQIYGKGVKYGPSGKYEGFWINGSKQGRGRFTYPDGSVYEGEWLNDKSNGIGIFYSSSGTTYTGQWLNDKRHGFGKEQFPNGALYEGEYDQDERKGEGIFIWSDRALYTGKFDQNKMNGRGKIVYNDGRTYEGEFLDGIMEGDGKFQWPDGRLYEGQYIKDRKHGFGKLIYPDGRQYEGSWKDGLMDGKGMITINGHKRYGIWELGRRLKWIE